MSCEPNPRRWKFCIWGMVVFVLLVIYPLGVGPWVYVYRDLPAPIQRFVQIMYFWIPMLEQSDSFQETLIGGLYFDYLIWWRDLSVE